jgi:hypothetical protein
MFRQEEIGPTVYDQVIQLIIDAVARQLMPPGGTDAN